MIATILNLRAPGMTPDEDAAVRLDLLITAFLADRGDACVAGVVTMMLMDIHFGTSFFSAAGGGDPVLFQHVFWVLRPPRGVLS
ncbi:hypothetical protein ACPA9J_15290 [Pseudomonas aeruginosa]